MRDARRREVPGTRLILAGGGRCVHCLSMLDQFRTSMLGLSGIRPIKSMKSSGVTSL